MPRKTKRYSVQYVDDVIQETLQDLRDRYFIDGSKLTFVMRNPDVGKRCYMIVTGDEPEELAKLFKRMSKKQ